MSSQERRLEMLLKSPVILSLAVATFHILSAPSVAATASRGRTASDISDSSQVAFIDALLNSFKGAAALKATCKTVWHSNEKTTFVEQQQCANARKEINLAKQYYPRLIKFVDEYRGFNPSFSVNGPQKTVVAASDAYQFLKLCDKQIATRAAKTMDYWGTTNVGDWYYENLDKMGASKSGTILEACKKGSWVYSLLDKARGEFVASIDTIGQLATNPAYTKACTAGSAWSDSRLELVEKARNAYANALQFSDSTLKASSQLGFLDIEGEIEKLSLSRPAISKLSSSCEQSLRAGELALRKQREMQAEKERQLKIQRERERVAAERRKAEAAAAERRRQAAAAERRKVEAERRKAIEGVQF